MNRIGCISSVGALLCFIATARSHVVVLDFEEIVVSANNNYVAGVEGPEYTRNGFTLNNTGTVFGPSGVYFVDEGAGYPSTAVYPQYNRALEIRRADGGSFDFASLDVTTDPKRQASSGVLTAINSLGESIGTVPFTYSADPSIYTTVVGNFEDVTAIRVSFAGNLDASRGAIDNVTLLPEPTALSGLAAIAIAATRRQRRVAREG